MDNLDSNLSFIKDLYEEIVAIKDTYPQKTIKEKFTVYLKAAYTVLLLYKKLQENNEHLDKLDELKEPNHDLIAIVESINKAQSENSAFTFIKQVDEIFQLTSRARYLTEKGNNELKKASRRNRKNTSSRAAEVVETKTVMQKYFVKVWIGNHPQEFPEELELSNKNIKDYALYLLKSFSCINKNGKFGALNSLTLEKIEGTLEFPKGQVGKDLGEESGGGVRRGGGEAAAESTAGEATQRVVAAVEGGRRREEFGGENNLSELELRLTARVLEARLVELQTALEERVAAAESTAVEARVAAAESAAAARAAAEAVGGVERSLQVQSAAAQRAAEAAAQRALAAGEAAARAEAAVETAAAAQRAAEAAAEAAAQRAAEAARAEAAAAIAALRTELQGISDAQQRTAAAAEVAPAGGAGGEQIARLAERVSAAEERVREEGVRRREEDRTAREEAARVTEEERKGDMLDEAKRLNRELVALREEIENKYKTNVAKIVLRTTYDTNSVADFPPGESEGDLDDKIREIINDDDETWSQTNKQDKNKLARLQRDLERKTNAINRKFTAEIEEIVSDHRELDFLLEHRITDPDLSEEDVSEIKVEYNRLKRQKDAKDLKTQQSVTAQFNELLKKIKIQASKSLTQDKVVKSQREMDLYLEDLKIPNDDMKVLNKLRNQSQNVGLNPSDYTSEGIIAKIMEKDGFNEFKEKNKGLLIEKGEYSKSLKTLYPYPQNFLNEYLESIKDKDSKQSIKQAFNNSLSDIISDLEDSNIRSFLEIFHRMRNGSFVTLLENEGFKYLADDMKSSIKEEIRTILYNQISSEETARKYFEFCNKAEINATSQIEFTPNALEFIAEHAINKSANLNIWLTKNKDDKDRKKEFLESLADTNIVSSNNDNQKKHNLLFKYKSLLNREFQDEPEEYRDTALETFKTKIGLELQRQQNTREQIQEEVSQENSNNATIAAGTTAMAAAITCTTMIALAASAVATAGVTLGIACLGMGCYAAASSQSNDMGRAR